MAGVADVTDGETEIVAAGSTLVRLGGWRRGEETDRGSSTATAGAAGRLGSLTTGRLGSGWGGGGGGGCLLLDGAEAVTRLRVRD